MATSKSSSTPSRQTTIIDQSQIKDISSTIWSIDANHEQLISNNDFNAELGKETKTKGTWQEDYTYYCTLFRIIPCPFIKSQSTMNNDRLLTVNFDYCRIDQASLRAALLAMSCIGSRVYEISFHGCQLTPQSILDLGVTLAKMTFISSMKLEYFRYDDLFPLTEYAEAFKQLIASDFGTDYLSFRGSKLGDIVVTAVASALSQNSTFKSLNLKGCCVSDLSFSVIIDALYTNFAMESVSLVDNLISGTAIVEQLSSVARGRIALADDTAIIKAIIKKSADRAKKVKDINRKRRKSTLLEYNDAEVNTADRIIKAADGQNIICNRLLSFIDISNNQVQSSNIVQLVNEFASAGSLLRVPESYQLKVRVKGVAIDDATSHSSSISVTNV